MHRQQGKSMFVRILLPLLLVMLLQSALFYSVTVYGSVMQTLEANAVDILNERTENRKNELESRFTSQWKGMRFYNSSITDLYESYLQSASEVPFCQDNERKRQFLADVSNDLISILRTNAVNGVFLILNNADTYQAPGADPQSYYGLCIRDYDPSSGYTDKEDLQVIRCPSVVASQVGITLDSYWEATYVFDNTTDSDFFFKPLELAAKNPGISADNFTYLSNLHRYSTSDRLVQSYSMPLIAADGTLVGVIGIEMTQSSLDNSLPSEELQGADNSAYLLVRYQEGSNELQVVAKAGTLFTRCFGDAAAITLAGAEQGIEPDTVYSLVGRQNVALSASVSPITVYNRNTPFEEERYALVGMVQDSSLFEVREKVRTSLMYVILAVLVLGVLAVLVVSKLLTGPLKRLASEVQHRAPADNTPLQHTNITEVDRLVDAIETQSRTINQTKVRTEFFSRMSHDMRTPMNAIIGFSSPEVIDNCDKKQLMEYIGKINSSGKYLLGLINEVLDMTKIDSGHMELDARPFETRPFWEETVSMVSEVADQKGLHFVRILPEDDKVCMVGDAQRLSQVVVNLLSNAIKFTPAEGTVTLSVQEEKKGKNLICHIVVADTGSGMSKEFQEKMYQPFVQEHINREGTGLGLSITYQLVELMQGTIRCESELGKGTTFLVDIPFPVAAAAATAKSVERVYTDAEIRAALAGKRVLLCEDHPLNRQIACRLLTKYEVLVDAAENGRVGADLFASAEPGTYDAVLMDIRMPVMDGLETARTIRAMQGRPDARTVPIIAMTANAFREDREASRAAGMNAHLAKPIEPQQLYATLVEYLSKQENKH